MFAVYQYYRGDFTVSLHCMDLFKVFLMFGRVLCPPNEIKPFLLAFAKTLEYPNNPGLVGSVVHAPALL